MEAYLEVSVYNTLRVHIIHRLQYLFDQICSVLFRIASFLHNAVEEFAPVNTGFKVGQCEQRRQASQVSRARGHSSWVRRERDNGLIVEQPLPLTCRPSLYEHNYKRVCLGARLDAQTSSSSRRPNWASNPRRARQATTSGAQARLRAGQRASRVE